MLSLISYIFIFVGLFFWFWGTLPLLSKNKTLLYRLHTLTVADTVGSALILIALIIRDANHWPILTISLITLTLWNTIFGYLLGNLVDK